MINRDLLKNYKIKIFTRSFSLEMYENAKILFKDLGFPCVRLVDQMADGYFYTILKDKNCDIAINIDEDAFVISPQAILSLIEYVIINNIANAGCPDGGIGAPRIGNPVITNPFFNIFNLKLIRSINHNQKDIHNFKYLKYLSEMENNFPKNILTGKYNFKDYDREPYYPFFFWLAYNFKTLYLKSEYHKDKISTILYNHNNEVVCYHSWFARFYKIDTTHTQRIKSLLAEALEKRGMKEKVYTRFDQCHFLFDFCLRRIIRVPMRIFNWPNKWKKWYLRYKLSK